MRIIVILVSVLVFLLLSRSATPAKDRVSVKVTFDPTHTSCDDERVKRIRKLAKAHRTRCLFVVDTPHIREKTLPSTRMINVFVNFEDTTKGIAWANRLHAERDPSIVGIFVHEYTSSNPHLF